VDFYRQHPDKKRTQNAKRRAVRPPEAEQAAPEAVPGAGAMDPPWPEPLVEHVRVVVGLIEHRKVTPEEILQMLAKVLRQQGIGRRRRIDHTVTWLNEHPP
jgi:hypothetical protein